MLSQLDTLNSQSLAAQSHWLVMMQAAAGIAVDLVELCRHDGFKEIVEAVEVCHHFVEVGGQVVVFVAYVVVIEFQQRVAQLVGLQVDEHVVKQVQGFVGKQGVARQRKCFAGHSWRNGGHHRVGGFGLPESLRLW